MADNIQITAGSGTTILTDDCTSGHAQVVKLAIATDGSATMIPADGTDGLLVNLGANNDVAVTGSVTANAGTNLNTSALALETGGNLAGAATSLAVVDDWDESDRAKINPIVGQAGIAAGAGAVGATVPRVTLASDDPVTTSVQIMDDWDAAASDACSVAGDTAHDATDAGEPVKIGARVETALSGITLAADGDRTNLYADADGVQVVKPFTVNGDILVERLSNTDGNSTASTVFGATADCRNCITTIAVYNASTTNGYIDFRDGTAGTVLFTLPLPANGGAVCNFPLPLRQSTANTAFAYDVSAALTTVYISLIGFKSKA